MKLLKTFAVTFVACATLMAGLVHFSHQAQAALVTLSPNDKWHVQLDGTLKTPADRRVFVVDLFDTTATKIQSLKSQGKVVICYFSGGTYEEWRPDAGTLPVASIGKKMADWDENWLDIRNPGVLAVHKNRMNLAVQKGCDGIDVDNVDGFTNDTGFPLTKNDQITFLTNLSNEAHGRNLLIGLKNALDVIPNVVSKFDFAINESCMRYNECQEYAPFKAAQKPVFAIDYQKYTAKKCTKAKSMGLNMQFYTQALNKPGTFCP